MRVTKLDRRYNCHTIMAYMIEADLDDADGCDLRTEVFKKWRAWCWEAFGPGCETKWIVVRPYPAGPNGECGMVSTTRWAWHTEYNEQRLYFQDEATLSAFMLQWS